MKITGFFALMATTQAIKTEYTIYDPDFKLAPPIWSVIKRGAARDFADANVQKAMERNPSSGEWPIPPAPLPPPVIDNTPHWAKQPWESVVKKGNSEFSDTQVTKALKLIPEVIAIEGKAVAPGGVAGDAEAAALEAQKKKEAEFAAAQSQVPEEAPKGKPLDPVPATVLG